MCRTGWIIIIHPDHTLLVSSYNCHLPIGEEEISSGHAYTSQIPGENDELIWVLLQCGNMFSVTQGVSNVKNPT
jgi:hypothetical protein